MSRPCTLHRERPSRACVLALACIAAFASAAPIAHAATSPSPAPSPSPDPVVVLLRPRASGPFSPVADAFRAQYDGRLVEIIVDKLNPDSAAREVRAARPAVIVALGARSVRFAHERFGTVPLVYGMVGDPARLALAGANATGVGAEVAAEVELAALRAIVPGVTRVAFLQGSIPCAARLRDARSAAERAGLTLVEVVVHTPAELPERLQDAMSAASAVWLAPDTLLAAPETFRFIVESCLKHRTPLFVFAPPLVRAGALAAADPDMAWVGGELADRVRRIRTGKRAADLPVSAARSAGIVFNPATARAIGVEMPANATPLAEERQP